MKNWFDPETIRNVIIVCICSPAVAIIVTLLILALRGRRQVLKNQRDDWIRW